MSVLIKNMEMPKGCIYANDNDQTEYCPLLNHDDVPFCQYIESDPEIAIGIDERPVYCPLSDVQEPCENTVSRQAAIDAIANCTNCGDEKTLRAYVAKHNLDNGWTGGILEAIDAIEDLPSAQPEDYTELKREFLRMASYIDVLLECSDEQKETLIGFISRLAEFMPWTERD